MMKKTALSFVAILAAVSSASAVTIAPTHDGFIRGNQANTVQPDTQLTITSSQGGRIAYIQFDLSGQDGTFSDAVLSVSVSNNNNAATVYDVYGLNDLVTGEAWDESTLTYNNAPGNGGFPVITDSSLLDSFTLSSSTTSVGDTINLSASAITDYLNADTNGIVSFIIVRNATNGINGEGSALHSTEGNALLAPSLEFTVTSTIPEPSTVVMLSGLGLVMAGLVIRRRRK